MQLASSRQKLRLLWALVRVNWQQETAYLGNKFFALLTPTVYVLSFLVFNEVLFQNIDSIAGYNKDQMLLLIFLGQVQFYLYSFWDGTLELDYTVNTGSFDYYVIRPVSSLFYSTFHKIRPMTFLIHILGPLTPFWFLIDWSATSAQWTLLPFTAVVIFMGAVLFHQAQFMLTCIAFWTGKARSANFLVYAASSQNIPLEGLNSIFRTLLIAVIPVSGSLVATSILTQKTSPYIWTMIFATIYVGFSLLKRVVWRKALTQYSSASS